MGYGIAHILGILLKNSYKFQILLEATFIYSLSPSNRYSQGKTFLGLPTSFPAFQMPC